MVIKLKHAIDLEKYKIRTDLVSEQVNKKQDIIDEISGIKVNILSIDKNEAIKYGKKEGNYITIEFEDATDEKNKSSLIKVFTKYLKYILKKTKISSDSSCLVIGLGNRLSTPDCLGPLCIDNIIITNHIYLYDDLDPNYRRVSAIAPGVTGSTGIETSEYIKGVINTSKPDFVIVVDSLASKSIKRLNKTIQITNTGISPGSGVGNKRKELSYNTLGIPVIAIGVPTVVDAISIVSDTLEFISKKYAFTKKNKNNSLSRMLSFNYNYLKSDANLQLEDKKNLFGLIGSLNDMEIRKLLYEVLTPIGYNLIIAPKEVDFIVKNLSLIISTGINNSLHKKKTLGLNNA